MNIIGLNEIIKFFEFFLFKICKIFSENKKKKKNAKSDHSALNAKILSNNLTKNVKACHCYQCIRKKRVLILSSTSKHNPVIDIYS